MTINRIFGLLKKTYSEWNEHNAPRLGASVAFYSILSFAPLLVLITAVIALVFGHESAQNALVSEARQLIGNSGAETVETLLKNAQKPASGAFASIIAFATLLFGASGVFTELQAALNLIWEVEAQASTGVVGMIRQRLLSFGMVLSIGFLLMVSLLLSAGLSLVGKYFGQLVPVPPFILQTVNFIISFVVIGGLFALMFKYLPATKVVWKDVVVGAIGTALLFAIGKQLLGVYIGKASVGSTFGAAGSLVAVVVWIYYSAQIFFFGAEFTHVYSDAHSPKKIKDQAETAKPVPDPANAPAEIAPAPVANIPARVSQPVLPPSLPARAQVGVATKGLVVMAVIAGFFLGRANRVQGAVKVRAASSGH